MRVYRIEHVDPLCDDERRPHMHGPHMGTCRTITGFYTKAPSFGEIGPTPQSDRPARGYVKKAIAAHYADRPRLSITRSQICGVLETQFDLWWKDDERDLRENWGWAIVPYDVKARDPETLVGEWQVVFNFEKAKRGKPFTDVKRFIGKHVLPTDYMFGLRYSLLRG